jgi:hypothetical protein
MMILRRSSALALLAACTVFRAQAQTRPTDAPAGPAAPASAVPGAPATNAISAPLGSAALPSVGVPLSAPAAATATRGAASAQAAGVAPAKAPAANARPSAMGGAQGRIDSARKADQKSGDVQSSEAALDRIFDAAETRRALETSGVAGRVLSARSVIMRKAQVANIASPADAPKLYQDAIEAARAVFPAAVAAQIATVVKGSATRKAHTALGNLASSIFSTAAAGQSGETKRLFGALDQWEALLGAPGRPLITNAAALKAAASDLLAKNSVGGSSTAPHVWLKESGGSYTAALPGSGVPALPALAKLFSLSLVSAAPEASSEEAQASFALDPRASVGARLIYAAARAQRFGVPAAALVSGRFWLRAVLEALWRNFVSLFRGAAVADVSSASGRDALIRDSKFAAAAQEASAAARRHFAEPRPTVAGVRRGFEAAALAASRAAELDGDARAAVGALASLASSFDEGVKAQALRPAQEVPQNLLLLASGPGGALHWLDRVEAAASRRAASLSASTPEGVTELGDANGPARQAAALTKTLVSAPISIVALSDRLLARGRGPGGLVVLDARLRATSTGGGVNIKIEKFEDETAKALEKLGFTVAHDGAGLRASVDPSDFARDGGELAQISAQALALTVGRGVRFLSPSKESAALGDALKTDRELAARLAALFDGRAAFARAPVFAHFGAYEAVGPVSLVLADTPLRVTALRDPYSNLVAYARAVKADGGALSAAQLRALLSLK